MNPRSLGVLASLLVVAILAAIPYAGCSGGSHHSSSSVSNRTPETFQGTLTADGVESGVISVVINFGPGSSVVLAATVGATGSIALKGGGTVNLTGSFDTASQGLTLSGGGYSFVGVLSATAISGSYTGPQGAGSFSALQSTGSGSVLVYCGTYAQNNSTNTGVWNMVQSGGSLVGSFSGSDGATGDLSGTISGDSVSVSFKGGSATGTLSGTTMSGTWHDNKGNSGPWQGSTGSCS